MTVSENWFVNALIAMCCYAAMALCLKHLSQHLETPKILFYLFAISAVFFTIFAGQKGMIEGVTFVHLAVLVAAAGFAFFGNYFDLLALSTAPNAGYAAAVKGGQMILITLAALALFKDQTLTLSGVLGVLCIVAGIALLALQKQSA